MKACFGGQAVALATAVIFCFTSISPVVALESRTGAPLDAAVNLVQPSALAPGLLASKHTKKAKKERDRIAKRAYANSKVLLDDSHKLAADSLVFGAGLSKANKKLFTKRLAQAMSMWDQDYGVIENYRAYIFTSTDLAWANEQAAISGDRVPFGSWEAWQAKLNPGSGCVGAFAQANRFYMCTSRDPDFGFQAVTVAHEYFHSIQSVIGLRHDNVPVWVTEGSAQYLGFVSTAGGFLAMRDGARNSGSPYFFDKFGLNRFEDYIKLATLQDIQLLYGALEVGPTAASMAPMEAYNGYNFGALAVEFLIGKYGYQTFMSFLEDIGSGTPWTQAFQERFKISKDQFYQDLHPYLQMIYR